MLTLEEFKTLWTAQKHTQYDDKYLQLDALLFEPKQWLPSMSISKKKMYAHIHKHDDKQTNNHKWRPTNHILPKAER